MAVVALTALGYLFLFGLWPGAERNFSNLTAQQPRRAGEVHPLVHVGRVPVGGHGDLLPRHGVPVLAETSGAIALFVYLLIALSELRRRLEREAPERLQLKMWLHPYLTILPSCSSSP